MFSFGCLPSVGRPWEKKPGVRDPTHVFLFGTWKEKTRSEEVPVHPPTRPGIAAPSSRLSPPASHSPAAICLSESLCPPTHPPGSTRLPTSPHVWALPGDEAQAFPGGFPRDVAVLSSSVPRHRTAVDDCHLKPERTVESEASPDRTQRLVQTWARTEPDRQGSRAYPPFPGGVGDGNFLATSCRFGSLL